ncbi:ADP-ribose pyrophosphatase YjhB, NUDIX family [Clostridium cavendishii DSM 21758]|uniref:8-oxo-dGTP diphosphatase n=1 Tax=Clostridium cavendishii DSM 21758 TaxID=1121302 RepID=A0A1M6HUB3_9CLOT|nr:NUDIX domain-containing protein [Clostridium cavendishii]SHJ25750.1 ADP-ribose pyrophosphatase YjhB, NUDIX family [Clostridium cavendishii DSM 21758]
MKEYWDLYDENRNKVNLIHERGVPIKSGLYHMVVSVWIRNKDGKYLMSKRHPNKQYPNLWECTGGAVILGETSLQAAIREVKEELGIELDENLGKLIYSKRRDECQDFYYVWLFNSEIDLSKLTLQEEEVVEARWMSKEEIDVFFEKKKIHPLLGYYQEIFSDK